LPIVQINGSAYYYDYHDQQVLSAVWGVNGPVGRFTNADKSRVLGGELELVLTPAKGLSINQYLSYSEGKYLDFQDLDVAASRAAGGPVYTDKSHTPIPSPVVVGWRAQLCPARGRIRGDALHDVHLSLEIPFVAGHDL
jgi:outer membrane receptor protein involved in Fe transport